MNGTMRAVQAQQVNGPLQVVEVPEPTPGPGEVRIAVEACGICHSDAEMVQGHFGNGSLFPMTPGHEIAGRIDMVGEYVMGWQVGDRVAVGWFGGNDGMCEACREGDAINCEHLQVPGLAYPGGYAESVVVPVTALARIPDELTFVEAAPMGCAGVTVFNGLRRTAAQPGDVVAILGLGGLGHLGVQFADKMGFDTVVIARGSDKQEDAEQLGARHYIDSTTQNVAQRLQAIGGAKAVLATATNAAAMTGVVDGLGIRGELVVAGVSPDHIEVSPIQLIMGQKTLRGHASGTAFEVEETMRFAAQAGVRPITEQAPLRDAGAAYDRMVTGKAHYRGVLTPAAG
jgi:alcohol dehydrogenase